MSKSHVLLDGCICMRVFLGAATMAGPSIAKLTMYALKREDALQDERGPTNAITEDPLFARTPQQAL